MNTVSSSVFHRRLDREPLQAVRTEGNYIYLANGQKLLDGGVSAAVTSIGYGDQRVIAGILNQLQTVAFAHSGTFTSKVRHLKCKIAFFLSLRIFRWLKSWLMN